MSDKKHNWIYGPMILIMAILAIFLINERVNINKHNSNLQIQLEETEKLEEEKRIQEELEREESERQARILEIEEIKSNQFMILVNGENVLEADYVPENLVMLDIKFQNYPNEKNLDAEAAQSAKEMFDAALQDGITLIGASGYRSYELQSQIYYGRVAQIGEVEASKYIAFPGSSEHQIGLALDIVSNEHQYLNEKFEDTEAFKWLMNNAYKYGFILRYLEGKEDITGYNYEPWHFRYIGNPEVAEYITKNSLTLEEFYEELDSELNELSR